TDQNSGNIWQNDGYQIIIDTRYPDDFEDTEMPGAEVGVCLVDGMEVFNFWSTPTHHNARQLDLADGDCASGLPSTDGKAIRGVNEPTADGFKEVLEVAFVKYPEMSDDLPGMLSICALDRDYDIHESVNQWAQGLFVKTHDEYGSVLWSSQSVPTAVESKIDAAPQSFALAQNYPNPFNPTTTISYSLKSATHITLKVYTVSGREVAVLVDEQQNAGEHTTTFTAAQLSSGVYVYQLQAGEQVLTQKMTLLQ
ncbi:T9SS type A sorting domain-containing protein, partial [candidate division KSB1 bacterium]|nr:T9SS type A sorting domain-containing protein [candidate division KSB1 bacterium]